MLSVIATLVVLVLLVLMAIAGFRDGAFFSTYALLRNLLAFFCAMTFCQPLARLLELLISDTYPAYDYFLAISFAGMFGGVFVLARLLKVRFTVPSVQCPELADRIVGPGLGVLNAVVMTGTVLILWSLFPFVKYIPGDLGRMQVKGRLLDSGSHMLRVYNFAEQRMGGGRVFLLDDEPIDVDDNKNRRADPGEGFIDRNKNERWDRGWLWKYHNHAAVDPSDIEPLLRAPEG